MSARRGGDSLHPSESKATAVAVNPNLPCHGGVRRSVALLGAMLMPGNVAIERATNRADHGG